MMMNGPRSNANGPSMKKNTASIRDKISRWEGLEKKDPQPTPPRVSSPTATANGAEIAGRKGDGGAVELQRGGSGRVSACSERPDSGDESSGKWGDSRPTSPEGPGWRDWERERERGILGKSNGGKQAEAVRDKRSVSTRIEKLERASKESASAPTLELPGNYFCPTWKGEPEEAERRAKDPVFGSGGSRRRRDPDNVYNTGPGSPSINPVPKPQRTFQHPPSLAGGRGPAPGWSQSRRNLPPLPSVPSPLTCPPAPPTCPPPLPTCPPPSGAQRGPRGDQPKNSRDR